MSKEGDSTKSGLFGGLFKRAKRQVSEEEIKELVDDNDEAVYAFTRTLGERRMLVMINLSGRHAQLPAHTQELLRNGVAEDHVVLSTYDAIHSVKSIAKGELSEWEGVVVQL